MTAVLRSQGRLFCGLALMLAVASIAGAKLAPLHELLAAGVLIALLGVPHGALDVVFARQLFGLSDFRGWAAFSLLYVALAVAVVGVWWVLPTFFLCAFLMLSALHFGGDPAAGVGLLARLLYGGTVIVLPALWHGAELQRLLGLVAGPASAAFVAPVLVHMAAPWLAATGLACVLVAKTSRPSACEWAALAALSVTAPPLTAFTLYFCAMHSPRHILRTRAHLPAALDRHPMAPALWPMLAVFTGVGAIAWLTSHVALEAWLMQLVFVGLAALTLPHMVLLEWARRAELPLHR
jgi:beta-carotene 15,15'-dioxygenase